MPQYKLAFTDVDDCRKFMEGRKGEVDAVFHQGLNHALALAPAGSSVTVADVHEWVEKILKASTDAADADVLGLVEALDCILSMDGCSSARLVDERRRR
jgi:hypothetical protein